MKKVRIFFSVAVLALLTAGVFAAKAKFTTQAVDNLYYYVSGTGYEAIDLSAPSSQANLVFYSSGIPTGSQATISILGTSYGLYAYESNAWKAVY